MATMPGRVARRVDAPEPGAGGPAGSPPQPDRRPTDRWVIGGLAAAVVVAAGVRMVLLDRPPTLSPDEAYSARVAALPLADIVGYVRSTDPHPPLSYLLLAPVTRITSDEAVLRLPSAVCSLAAVAVMAWWQRRRGWEGVLAVGLLALLPVAVSYGVQVRMYGLLQLCGVTAALAAERWLRTAGRGWVALAAGSGLVAALAHATGFIVLLGLLALPGRRWRGAALVWRGGVAIAAVVYAAWWGVTAAARSDHSLYDVLTVDSLVIAVNETVAPVPANRWVAVATLAAGVAGVLVRRDTTSRVLAACYLVPLAVAAAIGLRVGVFIPKTLVVLEWGVAVSLAGFAATAGRWRPWAAVPALVVVVALVLPVLPVRLDPKGAERIVERLDRVVVDGDVVVSHPPDNVLRWYVFRDPEGRLRPPPELGWPDALAAKVGDASWTGRVWLVESTFLGDPLELDLPACAPTEVLSERRTLRCVLVRADTRAG